MYRVIARSGIRMVLRTLSGQHLDPFNLLPKIGGLEYLDKIQTERNFIDSIGHPTIKGNRIIGDGIYEYLSGTGY